MSDSEQLGLFCAAARGRLAPRLPAASNDPQTSHIAARELVRSGRLTEQQERTLAALRAWVGPAPTSAELAAGDLALRFMFARRLVELERAGRVERLAARVCTQTGQRSHTWRAI